MSNANILDDTIVVIKRLEMNRMVLLPGPGMLGRNSGL